jgi:hypothetical protein
MPQKALDFIRMNNEHLNRY